MLCTTANIFISPMWATSVAIVWINVMFIMCMTGVQFTGEERVCSIAPAVGLRQEHCAGILWPRAATDLTGPCFEDLLIEHKLSTVNISDFYCLIQIAY